MFKVIEGVNASELERKLNEATKSGDWNIVAMSKHGDLTQVFLKSDAVHPTATNAYRKQNKIHDTINKAFDGYLGTLDVKDLGKKD